MITRHLLPRQPRFDTPLLFVHGAWHDSRCWSDAFLKSFTDAGWEVYTLDLPQHGSYATGRRINRYSIGDYVAAVRQDVETMGREPVLIGHSMGGLIVQKYLEQAYLKAAVLIAPAPPAGVWEAVWKVLRTFPLNFLKANLTLNLKTLVSQPEEVRWAFYSDTLDTETLERLTAQIQPESYLAFLGMLFPRVRKKYHNMVPTLVLGGEKDNLFSPRLVQQTAQYYMAASTIFAGAPHNLMLGEQAPALAARITEWLGSTIEAKS
jgi:pimeloyl-ACP methyl ester carboxylesterase